MNGKTENVTAQAAVEIAYLPIASIRRNGGTQSRVGLDAAHVDELAAVLRSGGGLPPVDVYHDGTAYWLTDGFHRLEAYTATGQDEVPATVHQGTRRDAVLYSVGANATHGLRRSNEDKRRAVGVLLYDAEWSQWSDRRIAEVCGVSDPFVGKLRAELQTVSSSSPAADTRKGADGKVRKVPASRGRRQLHPNVIARSTKATAPTPTVEATDQSTRFPPDWQPTPDEEELVAGILQVPRPATDETAPTPPPVLSDRDQKIHDRYTDGRTTKEIAEELGLSVSVVQNAKGRLGFAKRAPDNPFHGLIFNAECEASTLASSAAYVLQEKPATAEHIKEAVAALDALAAAVARTKAGLLTGTFGEDDDEGDPSQYPWDAYRAVVLAFDACTPHFTKSTNIRVVVACQRIAENLTNLGSALQSEAEETLAEFAKTVEATP